MSDRVSVLPEELLKLIRHGESFQIEYPKFSGGFQSYLGSVRGG